MFVIHRKEKREANSHSEVKLLVFRGAALTSLYNRCVMFFFSGRLIACCSLFAFRFPSSTCREWLRNEKMKKTYFLSFCALLLFSRGRGQAEWGEKERRLGDKKKSWETRQLAFFLLRIARDFFSSSPCSVFVFKRLPSGHMCAQMDIEDEFWVLPVARLHGMQAKWNLEGVGEAVRWCR